jgi:hypothetical protein
MPFLHGKRPERELAVQLHLNPTLRRQSFVSSIRVRLGGEFNNGKRPERELAVQLHLKPKLRRQSFVSSIPVRLGGEFNNYYVANILTSLCMKRGF